MLPYQLPWTFRLGERANLERSIRFNLPSEFSLPTCGATISDAVVA
jgi:hypothetical protein